MNSRNALEYSSQVHKYLNLQCCVPNPAPLLSSSPCTIISPPSSGCRLHSSCLIMSCYCFFAGHALPNSILLVSQMQNGLLFQLIIDEHSCLGGSALRILKLWGQVSPWFCHLNGASNLAYWIGLPQYSGTDVASFLAHEASTDGA